MRILFLSQRFLLPMDTGGKIRTGKLLHRLSQWHDVTLVSNIESPKDDPYVNEMCTLCKEFVGVPWRETKRHSLLFYVKLIVKLFSRYPVTVINDYSSELYQSLQSINQDSVFDLAICDFVQSARVFEAVNGIPTVLFQHNVEAVIPERQFRRANNVFAKLFWKLQWKRMLRFESKMCRSFDMIVAVSESDRMVFEEKYGAAAVRAIPTGVDLDYYSPTSDSDVSSCDLVFCGSMDWLPNEDAVVYFIKEIAPILSRNTSNFSLTIVGRNPSQSLKKRVASWSNICLTGWVEDTRPYIARSNVFIVPIRIGGGTRLKIYEAMAMGKAIVSTTVGAEGLDYVAGKHILIADEAMQFAKLIVDLAGNARRRNALGGGARKWVEERFGWDAVAKRFSDICTESISI